MICKLFSHFNIKLDAIEITAILTIVVIVFLQDIAQVMKNIK